MRHFETEDKLLRALNDAQQALDATRCPVFLSNVSHIYEDKYKLVEQICVSTTKIISDLLLSDLAEPSLDQFIEQELAFNPGTRFFLNFGFDTFSTFLREAKETKDSPTSLVISTEESGSFTPAKKKKKQTTVNLTQTDLAFYWNIGFNFAFSISSKNNGTSVSIRKDSSVLEAKTLDKNDPLSKVDKRHIFCNQTVEISSFLEVLKLTNEGAFKIGRSDKKTKTPCRNQPVEVLLAQFEKIKVFFCRVIDQLSYFEDKFVGELSLLEKLYHFVDEIDVPVIGFVTKRSETAIEPLNEEENINTNMNMNMSETDSEFSFLTDAEMQKIFDSFAMKRLKLFADVTDFTSKFANKTYFRNSEVKAFLISHFINKAISAFEENIKKIEFDTKNQICDAIGKHDLTNEELSQFLIYRTNLLLKPNFKLLPFMYDVRRSGHAVEGSISLENIFTSVKLKETGDESAPSVSFALNANNSVRIEGKQFLHTILNYKFGVYRTFGCMPENDNLVGNVELTTTAKQFSSFVLLLGSMSSRHVFSVKHALTLKNKDVVKVPLILSALPTAKEFRDAIHSLSENQQKFAKVFREYQLKSSVFALLIIPVKNALETVLKLPTDALTKEVELTYNLVKLFVEYQIPSDILSCEETANNNSSLNTKLDSVKSNVQKVMEMIEENKKRELKQSEMEADYSFNTSPRMKSRAARDEGSIYMCKPQISTLGIPKTHRSATCSFLAAKLSPEVSSSNISSFQPEIAVAEEFEDLQTDLEALTLKADSGDKSIALDYTAIPKRLENMFETLSGSAIRITQLKLQTPFTRLRQETLLSKQKQDFLQENDLELETKQSMLLLDALSLSGELVLKETQLHIVTCVTEKFEDTVLDYIVKEDVDIISKLQAASLAVGSVVHEKKPIELLAEHMKECAEASLELFCN